MTITETQHLAIDRVKISKKNRRKTPSPKDQATIELAASIKQTEGVLQPIIVRPVNGDYEIAAGARRRVALELAGLETIEAKVIEMDDETFLQVMFIENAQREDLDPMEEADLVEEYLKVYKMNYTTVAAHLGKTENWVARMVKLQSLCKEGKRMLKAGIIPFVSAIELARLPEDTQMHFLEDEYGEHWQAAVSGNVKEIRILIDEMTMIIEKAPWGATFENRPGCVTCAECPSSSGYQPNLFPEFNKGKKATTRCLDPNRWDDKMKAHMGAMMKSLTAMHENVVLITDGYYTNRSLINYGIEPGSGKIYCGDSFKIAKKSEKQNANCALWITGPKKGRSEFVVLAKTKDNGEKIAPPKKNLAEMNKTEAIESLASKKVTLEDKRFCNVIDQLVLALEEANEPDCDLTTDPGPYDFWLRHTAVFGGYPRMDWSENSTWKKLDKWTLNEFISQMWDVLRSILISRLRYQVMKGMKQKTSGEVERIALYIGFDIKEATKKAVTACPEPKAWAVLKLKANGSKLKEKKV